MHICVEKTIFMQKAIFYVSKLIAARGVIELTDRYLNFQVSPFEQSFGIRDISIDCCSIADIRIEGGELHPKIVVVTEEREYQFVLSKGQELYDKLKDLNGNSLQFDIGASDSSMLQCPCGMRIDSSYSYCPWCGSKQ